MNRTVGDADLFTPVPHLWTARATDANETVLGEVVTPAQRKADTVLFGVPFDTAIPGRPGARFGPDAIREQLAKLRPWTQSAGPFSPDVADWGNVRVPRDSIRDCHERVENAAIGIVEMGGFPLALGGDHSLTYPLVRAHRLRHSKVGVINLDAHLDIRDVVNGELNSGQSFGRLIEEGLLPGENYVCVGARDFANDPYYVEKAKKAGSTILGPREWRDDPVGTLDHAVDVASDGVDAVYLTVDIDVLDQADGPGVSAPTPGGPDTRMLLDAITRIARRAPLVGADVVETSPPLDEGGRTVRAAAHGVATLLAGRGVSS